MAVPQPYAQMIANLEALRDILRELGVTALASDIKALIKALQAGEPLPPPDAEAWKNLLAVVQQEEKVLGILVNELKRITSFEIAKKQQAVAHLLRSLTEAYTKRLDLAAEGEELKALCTKMLIPILRDVIAVLQTYLSLDKPRHDLVQLHQASMESLAMVMQDMNGVLGKEHLQSLASVLRHFRAQQEGLVHLVQAGSLINDMIHQALLPALAKAAEYIQDIQESIERNDHGALGTALANIGQTMPPDVVDALHDLEKPIQHEVHDLTSYHDQIVKDRNVIDNINKVWASIQQQRTPK